jgi:dipeptidase D
MTGGPFDGLEPKRLWDHFAAINKIARPSGQEAEMSKYIQTVADSEGFESVIDEVGNLRVRVPATAGLEGKSRLILQGHMDMVCSRDSDAGEYDPTIGKIRVFRAKEQGNDVVEDPNGEWIKAYRTTLGADNGIGVAAMLAIVEDSSVAHGPLDLLFTVQEEAGLVGAAKLDASIIDGKTLLNLDSEDEGIFTIGSAGGRETFIKLFRQPGFGPGNEKVVEVILSGLLGGHSGVDIHRGRLNAIRGLVRILQSVAEKLPFRLISISGGDRSNAIPREARAKLLVADGTVTLIQEAVEAAGNNLAEQYRTIEPNLKVTIGIAVDTGLTSLNHHESLKLLFLLRSIPSGVIAMSQDLPGLVETSNNLGVVKTSATGIEMTCNSRSALNQALDDVTATLVGIGALSGAATEPAPSYPGWKPDPNSSALRILRTTYKTQFGKDSSVAAVHAGLECGVLNDKISGVDMVSFGPTVIGAHSTRERVQIESVKRFYQLLSAALGAFAT